MKLTWMVGLGVSLLATSVRASTSYMVTDLGNLGGTVSQAFGINDSGQVVGTAGLGGTIFHAFLYSGGTMHDLGFSGDGYAINSSGIIVGDDTASSNNIAFAYNGSLHLLGTLGGCCSIAYAINFTGQVSGTADVAGNSEHGFIYSGSLSTGTLSGGPTTDINSGQAFASAFGINSAGHAVGQIQTGSTTYQPFYYDGTIHLLAGSISGAFAINTSGQIVGFIQSGGGSHAALFNSSGLVADLGVLGGSSAEARAINDAGVIVGSSTFSSGGTTHAFLYTGGTMFDLNNLVSLGAVLTEARGINSSGQIIANGADNHAYLLTPVPEPASLAMILAGLACAAFKRRRYC